MLYKTYLYLTRLRVAQFVLEKSTEKAQLYAMPKSFYLRFIKFPMRITVNSGVFACVTVTFTLLKNREIAIVST